MSGTMVSTQDMMNGLNAPTTPTFIQTNLVSDGSVPATKSDPNLVNPWGISFSSASPFWVTNHDKGNATLYNGSGVPQGGTPPLVVTIPPGTGDGPSAPTGLVFNGTGKFVVKSHDLSGSAIFIFAAVPCA